MGSLEILVIAVGGTNGDISYSLADADADESLKAERLNSEMLTHDQHNFDLILGLMVSDEFYVKYTTLQLMTGKREYITFLSNTIFLCI